MRVDAVHHRPVRDGVVESSDGEVVVREVCVAERDPIRVGDVGGEGANVPLRGEVVLLMCAK